MKRDIRIFLYFCSPFFFWLEIIILLYLFSLQNSYTFLSIPLMFLLNAGGHESVHNTLIPKTWKNSNQINFFSGCIAFALLGQNYLVMRWSHLTHHLAGRIHKEVTIDMTDDNRGIAGKIRYYLYLLGASALQHEIIGYLLPILPNRSDSDKSFLLKRINHKSKLFVRCQLFVLAFTLFLFYLGGIHFLACRILFLPLWGIGQNTAHYGLPVGKGKFPEFTARTYRVNSIVNFLFYGSFYHFEHHVMPKMPCLLLWHPSVHDQIQSKLGFSPRIEIGFIQYLRDSFRQFLGPFPKEEEDWLEDTSLR